MRVQKNPNIEAVGELAEFMNLDLSRCCAHLLTIPRPQLHGKAVFAVIGSYEPEITLEEQLEHGTTSKPLSAEQFAKAFRKLSCFTKWSKASSVQEWKNPAIAREFMIREYEYTAAEVHTVQQALNFILRPLVTAKNSDELTVGVNKVMEFLNQESWFVCPSSVREYVGYLSREHPMGTVDENLPPMRWRIEPKVRSDGKLVGWELNPYTKGFELYPVIMTVLAEAAVSGNLMDLKRCALEECRQFFVLKKQPGTRANFCAESCRVRHYNVKRITERRVEDKYKEMLLLARRRIPFTEDQARKVEKFMGMEEFEKFRAALRSGNPKPKLSAETRARFAQPRPRARRAQRS